LITNRLGSVIAVLSAHLLESLGSHFSFRHDCNASGPYTLAILSNNAGTVSAFLMNEPTMSVYQGA
jgi:hypothetical protein